MKKYLFFALAIVAGANSISAGNIFTGSQDVTWENTLYISADKFADANTGDEIVVKIAEGATDVIELKADGVWLPGTILTRLDGRNEVKAVVTDGMKTALQTYGLELCGPSFTITSIDLEPSCIDIPEGAVWSGFYWIDGGWNTLELFKTAFDEQNPQKITINLSPEAAESTFVINVLTKWDDDAMKLYGQTISNTQSVEITIPAGKTIASYLPEGQNALMVQGHVESGNSFNITSIVVEPYNPTTGLMETIIDNENETVNVCNMIGQIIRSSVKIEEATCGLTPGIYLVGNKKIYVK